MVGGRVVRHERRLVATLGPPVRVVRNFDFDFVHIVTRSKHSQDSMAGSQL